MRDRLSIVRLRRGLLTIPTKELVTVCVIKWQVS